MKAVRVTEYETTDGRKHRDRTVARKHQAFLELCHLSVAILQESNFIDGRTAFVDGANELADILCSRRDNIIKLLRNAEEAP